MGRFDGSVAIITAGQAKYSAAKAGLQGFTKPLALELGRYGITANSVAPGFIETDMTRATAERIGAPFEKFMKAAISQIPVAFFCDEASGFVNGQVIYVAGGPKT